MSFFSEIRIGNLDFFKCQAKKYNPRGQKTAQSLKKMFLSGYKFCKLLKMNSLDTLFLLLFSLSAVSAPSSKSATNQNELARLAGHISNSAASLALKKVLNNYQSTTLQINMEQEIFLSAIQTNIKSQGQLHSQGEKFYLKLEGHPSSVMIFDGKFLWYQADASEKVVFQLTNPSDIQILTRFFDEKKFFQNFHIQKARKVNQEYVLQLSPKKKLAGLSEIFMKFGQHISELRIVWKELDNWQKYKFSKPKNKSFPDKHFQFSISGFQVITKTGNKDQG